MALALALSAVLSSITAGCVAAAHVVDQGKGLTERSMAVIIASLEVMWLGGFFPKAATNIHQMFFR